MRQRESLQSAARIAASDLLDKGVDLGKKSSVTAVAKKVWKRHKEMTGRKQAKISSSRWERVHPGWKGRYKTFAKQGIASVQGTQPVTT